MSVVDDIIAADKLKPNPLLLYDVLSAIIDTMDAQHPFDAMHDKKRGRQAVTPRSMWLMERAQCLGAVIDDTLAEGSVGGVAELTSELQSVLDMIRAESPVQGVGPIMMGRSR